MASEKMTLRSFRIPDALCEDIKTASVRQRKSEADVVRDALRLYFSPDAQSPAIEKMLATILEALPSARASAGADAVGLADISTALGGILGALRAMDERITLLSRTHEREQRETVQAIGRHLLAQTAAQKEGLETIAKAFLGIHRRIDDVLAAGSKS